MEINELLRRLIELQNKVYGCGNGRNEIGKFIKQIKIEYGITD